MTPDVADRLVVTPDLSGGADKAGFLERWVRALELPDWFGRNGDGWPTASRVARGRRRARLASKERSRSG